VGAAAGGQGERAGAARREGEQAWPDRSQPQPWRACGAGTRAGREAVQGQVPHAGAVRWWCVCVRGWGRPEAEAVGEEVGLLEMEKGGRGSKR